MNIHDLLERTGALLRGHFRLSSGLHSLGYVQCARLLEYPQNANAIGAALAEELRDLGIRRVVSPALGGVIIGYTVAQALDVPMVFTERKDGEMTLRRGFRIPASEPVAIIEDVVTTGKSTAEAAAVVEAAGGSVIAFGAILDRSGQRNPFDKPFRALASLDLETWPEDACPLCLEGVPLDAPGSRYSGGR